MFEENVSEDGEAKQSNSLPKSTSLEQLGSKKKFRAVLLDYAKLGLYIIFSYAICFIYAMLFLLIASIFLLNIWKVTFGQILIYSSIISVFVGTIMIINKYKFLKR